MQNNLEKQNHFRILVVYINIKIIKIMENLKYLMVAAYANGLLFKVFHWPYGNEYLLVGTLLLNIYLGILIVKNIINYLKY